jgi:hypothetical protein
MVPEIDVMPQTTANKGGVDFKKSFLGAAQTALISDNSITTMFPGWSRGLGRHTIQVFIQVLIVYVDMLCF